MLTVRKLAALIACLGLLLGLAGCSGQTIQVDLFAAGEDVNANAEIIEPTELLPLADNGTYTMEYDPVEDRVNFRLSATGEMLWSTGVTEEEYGQVVENKMTKKALKQYINVKYTDYGKKSGAMHNGHNACETVLRRIENGIRFDFIYDEYDLEISLELVLSRDGFTATVPKNSIK